MTFRRFLELLLVALCGFAALRGFVFETISIATASMEPTLPVGTHAVLDKVTYRFRPPRRGEIVIFRAPVPPHEEMGKRVIGLPGETVELRAKRLFIDGNPVAEPYVEHRRAAERLVGDDFGPELVPPGRLFVLGDNRDESHDSSVWKDPATGEALPFVPLSEVRGVVRGFFR